MENLGNKTDDLLWIVKWNDFLCSLKRTIEDDEMTVVLSEMEDLEHIESIREIIDFKKLYSYLKQHQIDHARAWVFQFEKSMNEIIKFAVSRLNCPHVKELEEVVDKYEYEIHFINKKRDVFSSEDMSDIAYMVKEMLQFYLEYQIRVIDYEANLEYRKKYFVLRKGIELIPKESLCIVINCERKACIYVGEEYKHTFDRLLSEIGFKMQSYEIDETDIHDKNLEDYVVDFGYGYLSYYEFCTDASLSEQLNRLGNIYYVNEKAIVDAFEDDRRIVFQIPKIIEE